MRKAFRRRYRHARAVHTRRTTDRRVRTKLLCTAAARTIVPPLKLTHTALTFAHGHRVTAVLRRRRIHPDGYRTTQGTARGIATAPYIGRRRIRGALRRNRA